MTAIWPKFVGFSTELWWSRDAHVRRYFVGFPLFLSFFQLFLLVRNTFWDFFSLLVFLSFLFFLFIFYFLLYILFHLLMIINQINNNRWKIDFSWITFYSSLLWCIKKIYHSMYICYILYMRNVVFVPSFFPWNSVVFIYIFSTVGEGKYIHVFPIWLFHRFSSLLSSIPKKLR